MLDITMFSRIAQRFGRIAPASVGLFRSAAKSVPLVPARGFASVYVAVLRFVCLTAVGFLREFRLRLELPRYVFTVQSIVF